MIRNRRDRRGRGPRGPLAWPPVPAMRTRRELFDDLVLDAAERVRPHLGRRYADTEFAVEEVPPRDPLPWEDGAAALGRLIAPTREHAGAVVVYRRPCEARAHDDAELAAIVGEVVLEQVAVLLGVSPDDL